MSHKKVREREDAFYSVKDHRDASQRLIFGHFIIAVIVFDGGGRGWEKAIHHTHQHSVFGGNFFPFAFSPMTKMRAMNGKCCQEIVKALFNSH